MPPRPTVVISGIGLATSLGPSRATTWRGVRAGQSGAAWLDRPELAAGQAGFPLADGAWLAAPEPVLALLDRLVAEAITDARLDPGAADPDRVGVLLGLSKGGLRSLGRAARATPPGEPPDWTALAASWPLVSPAAGAAAIARRYDWRGPCLAPVAACATGLVASLQGADLIRRGVCDVVLAGSADASLDPLILGAFRRMRVLAREVADPRHAVRPWSRDRSGFLVGEGGAVLVLERLESARARRAPIYAELAGGAIGADATHETALDADPSGLAHVITRALRQAVVDPGAVAAVNLHGTATGPNDPLECRALHLALGPDARRVACSANKSQIGHLLGAAGSAELALAALGVRDGFVAPTLNLDHPDPACDLDATPHQGRAQAVPVALKLALGFGGHLAVAVLRAVP